MSGEPRWLAPEPAAPLSPLEGSPRFSIVIATYQAADTVARSVESALVQTYPAHEVIVVDDGSTDHPEEALRPFADRVMLIRKPNGGGASALNAGAEAATGDFLAILDADDAYDPRRLEVLAELARERPDLDLITTDARFVVEDGEGATFATYTPFVTEDQRTAIFESCFVGGWPAIRLSRLREIGGFDEGLRTGYDWDCWARLLLDGSQAGMAKDPYYRYYLHAGSLTTSRASSLWDRATLLEKGLRNPALRAEERPALERAIRMHRSRAAAAEAQDAIYGSAPRRRLLRSAFAPRLQPRARLSALLAATAPPLARRLVPRDRPAEERVREGS
jgi:glycosyltransferase involved in cell wall biosynthesis